MARVTRYGTIKPPPGASIDWGHPLAQGLIYASLCDSIRPYDLVNNRVAFLSADAVHCSGPDGVGVKRTSTLGKITTNNPKITGWNGRALTLAAHATLFSIPSGTYGRIIMLNTTQGAGDGVVLRVQTSPKTSIGIIYLGSSNMRRESKPITFSPLPVTFKAVGTHGGGTSWSNANIYYNGVNVSDDSDSTNGDGLYTLDGNITLLNSSNQTWSFDGIVYCAMVWERKFTEQEARWWSEEPYCMFIKEPSVTYSIPSSGGGQKHSAKIYIVGSVSAIY